MIIYILLGIFYASILEWILHRYFMHRPQGTFTYPYIAHALTHHRIFKADPSYHLQKKEDAKTIPMAWWNGIALALISGILPAFFSWRKGDWSLFAVMTTTVFVYYCMYEYIHWCMHLPLQRRQRLIEKNWFFYRLNGHHLLHHRYMNMNFNVVLPLADLLMNTLLTRSPKPFLQPRGPSVPDVQPRPQGRKLTFMEIVTSLRYIYMPAT